MICANCKTGILDTALFCRKCGTAVESIKKILDMRKKCPSCGADNLLSAKFCRVDGYRFYEPDSKSAFAVKEYEKQESGMKCPLCDSIYPPGTKFCKKDGTSLSSIEAVIHKDKVICSKCGTAYDLGMKYCKKDGTNLQNDIMFKDATFINGKINDLNKTPSIDQSSTLDPEESKSVTASPAVSPINEKNCQFEENILVSPKMAEIPKDIVASVIDGEISELIKTPSIDQPPIPGPEEPKSVTASPAVSPINEKNRQFEENILVSPKMAEIPKDIVASVIDGEINELIKTPSIAQPHTLDPEESKSVSASPAISPTNENNHLFEETTFDISGKNEMAIKEEISELDQSKPTILPPITPVPEDSKSETNSSSVSSEMEINATQPCAVCVKKNKTRKLTYVSVALILLVFSCAGIYFFSHGYFGRNPVKIAAKINAELKSKGLDVNCDIDKSWTATLNGIIKSPSDRELAIGVVNAHKEVKTLINGLKMPLSPPEVNVKFNAVMGDSVTNGAPDKTKADNDKENDTNTTINNYLIKGKKYHEDGKFPEARKMFRKILKLDKTNKDALDGIADANSAEKALLEK